MDAEIILTEARGWIGTRFSHQGRRKRGAGDPGGVDCLGLLIGVAASLDLRGRHGTPLTHADRRDYSRLPDGEQLREQLGQLLWPVMPSALKPGDIALFTLDRNPQHLGMISTCGEALGLIHAYATARCVVEHRLDAAWRNRLTAAFRIPALMA